MSTTKILLTGNLGVGKSSLCSRFSRNEFSEQYLTTMNTRSNTKWVSTPSRKIELCVVDTPGEVDASKLPNKYWSGVQVVVYVVDATRQSTLDNITADVHFIQNTLPHAIVKVVANKIDLIDAQHKAKLSQHYMIDFFTSAKTGEQVNDLFLALAEATDAIVQH
ncbi:MAG: GTP-binding protein [Saprospiraceae bacterium]|nr:GTP-binding protein [Saprospiraceae bacterium]